MLTWLEFYFFETPAYFLLNDDAVGCYFRYFFANQLEIDWVNIENRPKLLLAQVKDLRIWIHWDSINGVENSLLDKTKISKSLTFLQTLLNSRFIFKHVLHDLVPLLHLNFLLDDFLEFGCFQQISGNYPSDLSDSSKRVAVTDLSLHFAALGLKIFIF